MTSITNTTVIQPSSSQSLIRNTFRANSVTCLFFGLLLTFASNPIAEFMGINESTILGLSGATFLFIIGFGTFLFGIRLIVDARREQIKRSTVVAYFIADSVWVLASIFLIVSNVLALTSDGKWAILIVADIVGTFVLLEGWILWKWGKR